MREKIPPLLYELTLRGDTEKGIATARAVLVSAGTKAEEIADEGLGPQRVLKVFFPQKARVQRLRRLFQKLGLTQVSVSVRPLRSRQWLTRWKTHWKPAALTRHLDVVPLWQSKQYRPKAGRGFIVLDTVLSFGTGLHETTRFMAQFIEDYSGRFDSFIDIGTGTGILAVVALKYGARRVLAIDIDELSVEAAKANLKANRLKALVRKIDIKKFRHQQRYDFVAANLITHDLIEFRRQILRLLKPGGYLAVSGISLENLPQFERAFRPMPLKRLNIKKGKQWAGLLFQKRM